MWYVDGVCFSHLSYLYDNVCTISFLFTWEYLGNLFQANSTISSTAVLQSGDSIVFSDVIAGVGRVIPMFPGQMKINVDSPLRRVVSSRRYEENTTRVELYTKTVNPVII